MDAPSSGATSADIPLESLDFSFQTYKSICNPQMVHPSHGESTHPGGNSPFLLKRIAHPRYGRYYGTLRPTAPVPRQPRASPAPTARATTLNDRLERSLQHNPAAPLRATPRRAMQSALAAHSAIALLTEDETNSFREVSRRGKVYKVSWVEADNTSGALLSQCCRCLAGGHPEKKPLSEFAPSVDSRRSKGNAAAFEAALNTYATSHQALKARLAAGAVCGTAEEAIVAMRLQAHETLCTVRTANCQSCRDKIAASEANSSQRKAVATLALLDGAGLPAKTASAAEAITYEDANAARLTIEQRALERIGSASVKKDNSGDFPQLLSTETERCFAMSRKKGEKAVRHHLASIGTDGVCFATCRPCGRDLPIVEFAPSAFCKPAAAAKRPFAAYIRAIAKVHDRAKQTGSGVERWKLARLLFDARLNIAKQRQKRCARCTASTRSGHK